MIVPERRRCCARLSREAQERYRSISGREREAFALTYESCLPENANISDAVFRALESARGEDIRRGGTSFGPHREDLVLTIQGKDMRLFASQGQMRTAALAMKLSELAVFQQMAGEPPVLLLDDVMSELDLNRRKRLLDEIRGVQTLITCTDESDLNAQEKYIAAQITGFPLSLAIISAAALFAGTHGVRALAWGVFAAIILQTLVLVAFMRGWFHYRLIVDFRDRRFRHLMALAGPAVLSMAVSELNHMVDQWRASYGNPGDVSALSYGYKVITLLTGVVIVPLPTIMFSRMSRMVAEDNRRGILEIVRRSTVTIAMVMTPIIAICAVGNQDVIKALYLGGQFDLSSAAVTAGVFLFYVIGVLGFGLRDLLNRTFHAMQDTRTTMYVSAGIVVANVILNSIFHALMGVRGLALATTISGTGGMLVLFYLLRRRLRRLGMKRIVPDMAKIFLASGMTALAAWGVGSLMPVAESRGFAILRMLAMCGAGLGVYLLAALALKITPLMEFIGRKGNANDGRRTADHHGVSRGGRAGGRVAAPADADRVLRTGKTEKKPERVHAGRHRPPRAAGSSAAVRPARAGQDDAGRHHRRGDGAQHTHHQRPRHRARR